MDQATDSRKLTIRFQVQSQGWHTAILPSEVNNPMGVLLDNKSKPLQGYWTTAYRRETTPPVQHSRMRSVPRTVTDVRLALFFDPAELLNKEI